MEDYETAAYSDSSGSIAPVTGSYSVKIVVRPDPGRRMLSEYGDDCEDDFIELEEPFVAE